MNDRLSVPALGLALTLIAPALQAAPTAPVVVTATRLGSHHDSEPANVTVIGADTIEQSAAATLPQLLGEQAGVITRSLYGNNAARATVDLRGFGAAGTQNTLLLLNGRRLNDVDLSAVDYATLPVQDIDHIEIIRGAGGVLYGDGAVGGAINIVTRPPGRSGTRGRLRAAAGSYGTRELDASATHTGSRLSLQAAAQGIDSRGYRDHNALQQRNLLASARLPRGDSEWFLRAGADNQRLQLPGPRTVDPANGVNQLATDPRGTATPNDFAYRSGRHATAGWSRYWGNGAEAVVDAGYRTKNQKAFFDDYNFGGLYARYLDSTLATWSLTPRVTLPHRLWGHPGTTRFGADYYHADYTSDRAQNPATIDRPVHHLNVTQTTTAVYADTRLTLTPATTVHGGARLEWARVDAVDRADSGAPGGTGATQAAPVARTNRVAFWELGLRHQLQPDIAVYARADRSVRLATVDELFQTDPTTFVKVFTPLEPQTSVDLQTGLTYSPGRARLSANLYYMRLKDEIHYDPATFSNVNLDPTRRYGLELSARLPVTARLTLDGDFTYLRAQFRHGPNAGNDVPVVPRTKARVSARWKMAEAAHLTATARYMGSKYFDNDAANDFGRKIPAYTLVDMKLTRQWHHWQAGLRVNNLFDRRVYDYGVRSVFTPGKYNAYPLPGRSVTVSLSRSL